MSEWIRDLFGWFRPSEKERVPLPDGTLQYRMKGGPYDGEALFIPVGVTSTLTFHTRKWKGRYERGTSWTFVWKEMK